MKRVALTIGAAVLLSMGWSPAQAKTDHSGWAVRICRGESEASAIKIDVSDGKTTKLLVNWHSDKKQTTYAVTGKLARAASLTVNADSEPPDGKVVMCILWKGTPAKTMKFNDLLQATASQSDTDPSCPCNK
jgi:hypothetical protein